MCWLQYYRQARLLCLERAFPARFEELYGERPKLLEPSSLTVDRVASTFQTPTTSRGQSPTPSNQSNDSRSRANSESHRDRNRDRRGARRSLSSEGSEHDHTSGVESTTFSSPEAANSSGAPSFQIGDTSLQAVGVGAYADAGVAGVGAGAGREAESDDPFSQEPEELREKRIEIEESRWMDEFERKELNMGPAADDSLEQLDEQEPASADNASSATLVGSLDTLHIADSSLAVAAGGEEHWPRHTALKDKEHATPLSHSPITLVQLELEIACL